MKIIQLPKSGYNHQVVDFLRDLLQQAERGDIVDFIVTYTLDNGEIFSSWTGCEDLVRISAFLARQQHKIQQRMDGDG